MGNNTGTCRADEDYSQKVGDEESGWLFTVLEYCDTRTRCNATFLCKRYFKTLSSNSSFRWRLERLHIEYGIYCSKVSNYVNDDKNEQLNFKDIYLDLIPYRMLWCQENGNGRGDVERCVDDSHIEDKQDEQQFNVHVSVRFKPLDFTNRHKDRLTQRQVTLPLHQRLALIKHQNKLQSNSDALNILKEEGEWFKEKWSILEKENLNMNSSDQNNAILQSKDKLDRDQNLRCGIKSIDSHSVIIVDPTKGLRNFVFDQVYPDYCSQDRVYETSAQPLLQDFINGINACCLVYGVTGSGKSFTMFGYPHDKMRGSPLHCSNVKNRGIVPRACQEVFDVLKYREKYLNLNINAQVSLSYVEIFGNEISDLLRNGKLCSSNKAASHRFVLSGTPEIVVQSIKDVEEALEKGERQKRKAATAMNDRSSRAHSIVIISLKQVCKETGVSRSSKLFLCDLGGCEQTKKSDIISGTSKHFEKLKESIFHEQLKHERMIDDPIDQTYALKYSTGFVKSERMREAVYINLGLMALKACVEALLSKAKHIPYSDSKLTMMLSSALGGNSKTSVIVCAAQETYLIKETVAALKFGQSCRDISNSIQSENDFLRKLIDDLDTKICNCQNEIRKKERWEIREEKREDILAEDGTLESKGFGGVEVRKTTILVGAEREHEHLNDLLQQKAQLTGVSISTDNESDPKYGGEVGFGNAHTYGLGKKYDNTYQSDYRFGKAINSNVPYSVRSMVGEKHNWKGDDAPLNRNEKQKLQNMSKKSSLVYSGLSA